MDLRKVFFKLQFRVWECDVFIKNKKDLCRPLSRAGDGEIEVLCAIGRAVGRPVIGLQDIFTSLQINFIRRIELYTSVRYVL